MPHNAKPTPNRFKIDAIVYQDGPHSYTVEVYDGDKMLVKSTGPTTREEADEVADAMVALAGYVPGYFRRGMEDVAADIVRAVEGDEDNHHAAHALVILRNLRADRETI